MRRSSMMMAALLLGAIVRLSDARGPTTGDQPSTVYKGLFWYETLRPSKTLKHQIYDVGKGEYDAKAVARWLDAVGRVPTLGAYIRDIRTDGEPGATESERLASAIRREERRWAELNDRPARSAIPNLIETSTTRVGIGGGSLGFRALRGGSTGRVGFDRPSPGMSVYLGAPSSPFPYPYRAGPR